MKKHLSKKFYKHLVREARVWYLNQDHASLTTSRSVEETPFQTATAKTQGTPFLQLPGEGLSSHEQDTSTSHPAANDLLWSATERGGPIFYAALNSGKKALPGGSKLRTPECPCINLWDSGSMPEEVSQEHYLISTSNWELSVHLGLTQREVFHCPPPPV